jgi:hypothetical protein
LGAAVIGKINYNLKRGGVTERVRAMTTRTAPSTHCPRPLAAKLQFITLSAAIPVAAGKAVANAAFFCYNVSNYMLEEKTWKTRS